MKPRAGARLHDAAFALLAALPLAMALANRSATLVIAAAACLSLGGRIVEGDAGRLASRLRDALGQPVTLCCLGYLALALVSVGWSHHARISLGALGELALASLAPAALHLALPREMPRWLPGLAAGCLALACLSMLGELATDLWIRQALGRRAVYYIFKRSVTSVLLVYWPLAALLWWRGSRLVAAGLGLLLAVAIVASHAGAALVGGATGLVCLALFAVSRRTGIAVLAVGLFGALAVGPAIGDLAERALPSRLVDRLESVQARDRIAIWQGFGSVVAARPIAGTGFGTSVAAGRDPVAAEVPAERRTLLAVGHPHNGFLQVWAETGLLGAAVAALVFAALLRVLARGHRAGVLPGAAAVASAATVMLVGHGAWQGWWITTIGAVAIWCARLAPDQVSCAASSAAGTLPRNPVAST